MQTNQRTDIRSSNQPAQLDPQWQHLRAHLLHEKAQINQAIREYPLPITACDDQFNHLLAKRSRITQEIGRFNRLCVEEAEEKIEQKALDEFISSSQFIDNKIKMVQ